MEEFSDKFASLRIYKLYYERDKKETEQLKVDYSRTKFEAVS